MPDAGAGPWELVEQGFDPARANTWETLFCVGNGRMGTRGCLEEGHVGELSGTFVTGVYDGHGVPVIDLVNTPDWLPVVVHVDGSRLDVQSCEVVEHERVLDLRSGVLRRRTVLRTSDGRRTELRSWRFASRADRRLCALRLEVTPLDGPADVVVESAIEGRRRNLERLPVYPDGTDFGIETRWDKWARARHVTVTRTDAGPDGIELHARTLQTGIDLSYAATTVLSHEPARRVVRRGHDRVAEEHDVSLAAGETLRLDKLVLVTTSREGDRAAADARSLEDHRRAGFDACRAESAAAWEAAWADCDCEVEGDPEATLAVRFGIHQLLLAADGEDPTVNIGAKSLTGEGYRGHVFWDTEVMMLPFFVYTQPRTARRLLEYRHHTLPGARIVAQESGYRGARFPWESADTGREECPRTTPDGANVFWTRDEEVHVSADVAYGFVTYAAATGDDALLLGPGAETIFETSRFWVSRCDPGDDGGLSIRTVMGPDEFHSHVDDNAFTNLLARWHLEQAVALHRRLQQEDPAGLAALVERTGLEPAEVEEWADTAARLARARERDGVVEQFRGYFERTDVEVTEWDANDMPRYPAGYHHFNCEDTMLLKQPDVLMAMLMLPDEFSDEQKRASFDFYEARTLHKSSLSPAIHAIMGLTVGDPTRAMQYFRRSAFVDLHDNQGNTHEGVHIASAGGTWQVLVHGFAGFRVRHGQMTFDPWLPPEWDGLRFRLRWRGRSVGVHLTRGRLALTLTSLGDDPARDHRPEDVLVHGRPVRLQVGETVEIPLTDPAVPEPSGAGAHHPTTTGGAHESRRS